MSAFGQRNNQQMTNMFAPRNNSGNNYSSLWQGQPSGNTSSPHVYGNNGILSGTSRSVTGQDQFGNDIWGFAGAPQNGQMGTPQMGTFNSLMNWANQVPGGMNYLQSMGMAPVNMSMGFGWGGTTPGGSTGVAGGSPLGMYNPDYANAYDAQGNWVLGTNPATGQSYASGQTYGGGLGGNAFRMPNGPLASFSGTGKGNFNIIPNQIGQGQNIDFQSILGNGINQLVQNPTGMTSQQQQQYVNNAQSPYAMQQQVNEQQTRDDAIRRGASGSGGDADIRDQLNRSNMAGTQAQQQAAQGARLDLANLARQGILGALGAANPAFASQVQNNKSLRDMIMQLTALQSQMGPLGGLNVSIGGR